MFDLVVRVELFAVLVMTVLKLYQLYLLAGTRLPLKTGVKTLGAGSVSIRV